MKLVIDGKAVTVNRGATILEAAQALGVHIPTLCHDDRLHPYGACRICMVEVEGPPRRMLPACTTPAAEGMSVLTRTPLLAEARRSVLEFLLIHHPLECPVCDKAGECRLQDLVHEYGLGPGLFAEEKRNPPPDYASALIDRNPNRCILCGKCVRSCKERCGVGALTFSQRGGKSRVSTAFDRPHDCEFCGECIEICPVGALTAKQSKFKVRPWNLEKTPSTCNYCGCGCPITVETRGNAVVRVRSAGDRYLCAKGRFGWDALLHESRLAAPLIRAGGRQVDSTWDEALSVVATNLKVIGSRFGADRIGGLGSTRTTNEDDYVFQKFMRTVVGTNNVDLLARAKYPYGLNAAYFAADLERLAEHDVILMLDGDAGEINALTGVEIVKAVNRRGSRLILAAGERSKFNRIASVALPQEGALDFLIGGLRNSRRIVSARIKQATDLLSSAKSTAIVLSARLTPDAFALIGELADILKHVDFYPVVTRGNIQGALDMGVLPDYLPGYQPAVERTVAMFEQEWNAQIPGTRGKNALEMMEGAANGALAALYIMGDDPVGSDPVRAEGLKRLEFLVVQDVFLTETAKLADVVLPASGFPEKTGTITTIERRLRRLTAATRPAGESRPDWSIIQAVAERMGGSPRFASAEDVLKEMKGVVPMYRDLAEGDCWPCTRSPLHGTITDLSLPTADERPREVLTAGRLLFSSGMMTTRSKALESLALSKIPAP